MHRTVQFANCHLRLIASVIVLAVMGFAYLCAQSLAGDLAVAGLGDAQVRAIGHFLAYGSLAGVMGLALGGRFAIAWAATVLLAAGDELAQLAVPGRYADIGDWLIDVTGITLFIVVVAAGWFLFSVRGGDKACVDPRSAPSAHVV